MVVDVVDDGLGVAASEHVAVSVFERDEKAVRCPAIVGEVLSEVAFAEPAPVAKPSATAAYAPFTHGRWTWNNRCYVVQGYAFDFKRPVDAQLTVIDRYRQRHIKQCCRKNDEKQSCESPYKPHVATVQVYQHHRTNYD